MIETSRMGAKLVSSLVGKSVDSAVIVLPISLCDERVKSCCVWILDHDGLTRPHEMDRGRVCLTNWPIERHTKDFQTNELHVILMRGTNPTQMVMNYKSHFRTRTESNTFYSLVTYLKSNLRFETETKIAHKQRPKSPMHSTILNIDRHHPHILRFGSEIKANPHILHFYVITLTFEEFGQHKLQIPWLIREREDEITNLRSINLLKREPFLRFPLDRFCKELLRL
ncbi:hypothetical protein VNO77_44496 [Canavalia gladiata]|uniref:Uncharacterized protein n=1 Tax=Canavalia gladiata TaxID=3824 RepID=A0AAN9JX55_CANGL